MTSIDPAATTADAHDLPVRTARSSSVAFTAEAAPVPSSEP